jgi:putative ABC transport system permease protein
MNIVKIAFRNLLRYKRRTALTGALIIIGVTLVIVFGGVGNSFKNEVIGTLTGSSLGDIQIHKKGSVSSIDTLPLDMNMPEPAVKALEALLNKNPQIGSYSERIRFGAMISNFVTTTSVRVTGVMPERETATLPGLRDRIKEGDASADFVPPGTIVIPENLAAGLNLKVGSEVVLVATNKDGSVNGLTLTVAGITENLSGPSGRDGYLNIQDARTLLRIDNGEVSEIAIRLQDFDTLDQTYAKLQSALATLSGPQGQNQQTKPAGAAGGSQSADQQGSPAKAGGPQNEKQGLEIHTWSALSPFSSVAQMITLLLAMIRIVLVFIVLISVLNVMMMSVYERVGEIGTIASMGTVPSKILRLFLTEGLTLGLLSAVTGTVAGVAALLIVKALKTHITFGRISVVLAPNIPTMEILLAIGVVLVVSALASLQPALKASRMEPVEALRHV